MSLKFERKLPVILLFVVTLITITGFAFYYNTSSLRESLAATRETQQLLSKLDETLRFANDIESGVRGFVITGNETYLEPYKRARQHISSNLAEIERSAAENAVQLNELDQLSGWVEQFLVKADERVNSRRKNGYEYSIQGLTDPGYGGLSENIRRSIERLKAEEMTKMRNREAVSDRNFIRTIWILFIGSLGAIGALILANFYVSHEMKKRAGAERALSEANASLEETIEKRTGELKAANKDLEFAAAEREKLLKSEQSARKEAEGANRVRDQFMATVSHELRTPLNSILGWARMMRDGELSDERMAKGIGTIIKNSETQKRLIDDLMDVSRIMSGKLTLETQDVRVADLLKHSVESINPAARQKDIAVALTIGEKAGAAHVTGDRDRLVQVFTNLLTNAVKFTPERGNINVSAEADSQKVTVTVADTGIGIDANFLPHVFDRFSQIRTGSGQNAGLGLGLAIVRNLVEHHGGSVAVESDGENRGSSFTVSLPIAS